MYRHGLQQKSGQLIPGLWGGLDDTCSFLLIPTDALLVFWPVDSWSSSVALSLPPAVSSMMLHLCVCQSPLIFSPLSCLILVSGLPSTTFKLLCEYIINVLLKPEQKYYLQESIIRKWSFMIDGISLVLQENERFINSLIRLSVNSEANLWW